MRVGAILFALTALFAGSVAEARCDKAPRYLTEEYLRRWEIVAYGRVIRAHNDASKRHESFALLALEGVWQGDPSNPLQIYHSDSGG
ncbi:MAG: hypothetical protein OSB70_19445 [Myxococcota bacterium]|nr:hypothetical protein [Myxococcota bacterium]